MKTIIFVSAFKDINRKSWDIIPRTNDLYFEQFNNLGQNIRYKLVVYLEENIKTNLLAKYSYPSNIEFRDYNEVTTFFSKYIEHERAMISSKEFQDKVPADRKGAPEHWCAEYNFVNHSKINFVRHTKQLYPDYDYYSWLDFGCIRNTTLDVPNFINFNKLENKICYLALKQPSDRRSAEDMVKSHDVYLTGSMNVIHSSCVELFEQLYEQKLLEWQEDIICDEDQGLILQLYYDNPTLFQIYLDSEWFCLFRKWLNHKNLLNKKQDIISCINNYNCKSYIEIGVARGVFTKDVVNSTGVQMAYLIDPYLPFSIDSYTDGRKAYDPEEELNACKSTLSGFESRIEFIRKLSNDAVDKFADNSIDVIYIDGYHEYFNVLNDLEKYWPKVKRGGFLFGDDVYDTYDEDINKKNKYHFWDGIQDKNISTSWGVFGVHCAVVDFCKKYNLRYLFFSNQFLIQKY